MFLRDGAPANFTKEIRDHLSAVYGDQWVECGGPETFHNGFLWAHVKELVCSTPVLSDMDFLVWIVEAEAVIHESSDIAVILGGAFQQFKICNKCVGRYIEQLLYNLTFIIGYSFLEIFIIFKCCLEAVFKCLHLFLFS